MVHGKVSKLSIGEKWNKKRGVKCEFLLMDVLEAFEIKPS